MKLLNYALFAFSIAIAFYVGRDIVEFDFLTQFLLIVPLFYLIYLAHVSRIISITYYFYTIYYTLGYVVYLYVLYFTFDDYGFGGWMGVGYFSFNNEKLDLLVYSATTLMAGLYIGSHAFSRHSTLTIRQIDLNSVHLNIKTLQNQVSSWIVLSLILIVSMSVLGLGRTGLQDSTVLPFGLKGIMFYARVIWIPLFGFYFLEKSITFNCKRLFRKIVRWMILFAFLIAILFFSRSDLVNFLLPLVMYLGSIRNIEMRSESRRFLIKFLFVIIIGTQLVQVGRNVYYTENAGAVNISDIASIFDDIDVSSIVQNLLVLATIRQGGARDMGVVLNSDYNSIIYIWNFFWQIGEQGFMTDVWGFDIDAFDQEGKSFGTGFNGFGWYAFGGSLSVIFLLGIITGLFSRWVEGIFAKRNLKAATFFISFIITLMLWNSFVWGRVWRIVPMIIIAAYIIDRLEKSYFKNPTV